MSKNEPIAKTETAAEIRKELDAFGPSLVALVASKAKHFQSAKADLIQSALEGSVHAMISWSGTVVRLEHETMWFENTVRPINVLTTWEGVLNCLKEKVAEMQDRSEMSIAHSSSMLANGVELEQREALINVMREVRGWVKYMERRIELLQSMSR